jgi:hypothetical protein
MLTAHHPPVPHTILAIGDQSWGKGLTLTAALKELRKAHGPGLRRWIVYYLPYPPDDVWVDDMGWINWRNGGTPRGGATVIDRHNMPAPKEDPS